MKQKKAERRAEKADKRRGEEEPNDDDDERALPRLHRERQPANVIEKELDITFKDTLPPPKKAEEGRQPRSWTLSGREAEALHMEEEDDDEEEDQEEQQRRKKPSEPLRDLLQSGSLPI